MAKLSLRVFKQGKPVYWVIGGVFVFVAFYLLFNRNASSGSGATTVVSTGPSEQLQAAALQTGAQVQISQTAAQVEIARIASEREGLALSGAVAMANIAAGERISLASLDADKTAAVLNAQTNVLINQQNANYNIESARIASETQIGLRQIDIGLLQQQMLSQERMFDKQADNLITQTAIAQISTLSKKNRDEALTALTSMYSGVPNTYIPQSGGGGGGVWGAISPISNFF